MRSEAGVPRGPVLLACEKCEQRLAKEGRFRQIAQMQQALDAIADEAQANGSGLRILPVGCLDICPRGAMAVARSAERGRGPAETFIVRTPEDLKAVCAGMLIDAVKASVPDADLSGVDEGRSSPITR